MTPCAALRHVCTHACTQLGALIYAQRVPERWLPGRFDLLLHSHQIFHLLIVLAALVHYKAVSELLAWRDAVGGCTPTR